MKSFLETLVICASVGLFVAVLCWCLCGCKPAEGPTMPGYCANEAGYTAALLRCVDRAITLAESKACREQVNSACNITEVRSAKYDAE
jgi:hypothetical protein